MAFPCADVSRYQKKDRILTLEYDLSKEMKLHTLYGEISFEKDEVIKLFEKLKFSTTPIMGTLDPYGFHIDLKTAWATLQSIKFPDDKIILTLKVLETPSGNAHDACFQLDNKIPFPRFFTSVKHTNGKDMTFLTINYEPYASRYEP